MRKRSCCLSRCLFLLRPIAYSKEVSLETTQEVDFDWIRFICLPHNVKLQEQSVIRDKHRTRRASMHENRRQKPQKPTKTRRRFFKERERELRKANYNSTAWRMRLTNMQKSCSGCWPSVTVNTLRRKPSAVFAMISQCCSKFKWKATITLRCVALPLPIRHEHAP